MVLGSTRVTLVMMSKVKRARVPAATLLGILLGSVLLPAQVLAHHTGAYFGSSYSHNCDATPLSQCVANNGSHIYWFDADLIDVRRTAMVRGLNTYGVNSDVNVFAGNAGDVFDVTDDNSTGRMSTPSRGASARPEHRMGVPTRFTRGGVPRSG